MATLFVIAFLILVKPEKKEPRKVMIHKKIIHKLKHKLKKKKKQ